MRLRPDVHRKHAREEIGILDPAAGNLRRQRRRRPGVHDVGIAGEPARAVALVGRVALGDVSRRVDRQAIFGGQEPGVVVDGAVLAHAIPDGERHAEESLAADAPVAGEPVDPVLEPRLHVRRMPAELAAAGEQRLARVHRLDEPLTAGHDLERPVTLLVELHGVRDRTRLAEEIAALAEELDRPHAGLRRRQPRELIVVLLRARGIGRRPRPLAPRHRLERAVRLDHRADRQAELAPPDDVGDVAEGADHRHAGSLFRDRRARAREAGTRAPKSGVTTSVPKSG